MHAWPAPEIPRLDRTPEASRLLLHDTASAALQPAGPASDDQRTAGLYVCGITPYDATHIGHANTYVAFDLLNRVWRDAGLDVQYVQNVTDVDDPLLERATATGVDWRQLAADQTELFRTDMVALNVIPPAHYIGAVEAVPEVVELIIQLQAAGAVYQCDDADYPDLYFSQHSDDEFGSLSKLDRDAALATFAERGGDPDRPGKRDPLDCLVWRLARPGEPSWPAPFGAGRPGWHIECTAIALRRLGPDFDVQAGGSDLVFPHHEMCAAEGRVATEQPFAQVYAHSGMVGLDGEKMSKSRGNLVLVSRLRAAGVDPMAIRLALLSQHYRSDWMWTDQVLGSAAERLDTWRAAVAAPRPAASEPTVAAVRAALAADLDAPAALAAVDAWAAASLDGQHAPIPVQAPTAESAAATELLTQAVDALLGVRL